MFANRFGDRHRSVFSRVNARMVIGSVVLWSVMLPWKSYVNAEEFTSVPISETANVNIHADSQPLAVQDLEPSAVVDANDKASSAIDTDPDLSDVVQLDASKGDPHSQLDLAGSRDMQSLDVVDTGSSVKFTHAADDIAGGIDDQKANVDLGGQPMAVSNEMIDESGQLEADLNDKIELSDQPLVAVTSVNLSVTNTVDAHSQASDAGNQLKDASNDAVSDESADLPYAVVLALLALIGLVPVARRNDQHHV